LLSDYFACQKRLVELVADPGTTKIGKAIRQILLDNDDPISERAQMLLFSAARAELSHYIQKKLSDAYSIVCDRWLLSTLVYQVALNDTDERLVYDIFDHTAIRPDICVLLDIDPEDADSRKQHETRKDRYERVTLAEKKMMRAAYLDYARRLAVTEPKTIVAIVPAYGTVDEVNQRVLDVVLRGKESNARIKVAGARTN
jgi:dTMP kinase